MRNAMPFVVLVACLSAFVILCACNSSSSSARTPIVPGMAMAQGKDYQPFPDVRDRVTVYLNPSQGQLLPVPTGMLFVVETINPNSTGSLRVLLPSGNPLPVFVSDNTVVDQGHQLASVGSASIAFTGYWVEL